MLKLQWTEKIAFNTNVIDLAIMWMNPPGFVKKQKKTKAKEPPNDKEKIKYLEG